MNPMEELKALCMEILDVYRRPNDEFLEVRTAVLTHYERLLHRLAEMADIDLPPIRDFYVEACGLDSGTVADRNGVIDQSHRVCMESVAQDLVELLGVPSVSRTFGPSRREIEEEVRSHLGMLQAQAEYLDAVDREAAEGAVRAMRYFEGR